MIRSAVNFQCEELHQNVTGTNPFYQHHSKDAYRENNFGIKDGHSNTDGTMCGSPESGIECDQPISPKLFKDTVEIDNTPINDTFSEGTFHSNTDQSEKSIIELPMKTSTSCTNNLRSENGGLIRNSKRLYLRRIRSINGELKSVLMLDADYNVVANEHFLKDRENFKFTPIVFTQDSTIRLPNKKRYFFSLSRINELTKLQQKQKSKFQCNFMYSDSDDCEFPNDEKTLIEDCSNEEKSSVVPAKQNLECYPESPNFQAKDNENNIKEYDGEYVSTFNDSNQEEDIFYASDWDPEISETVLPPSFDETIEIEYNQEEDASSVITKPIEPSTSGLSKLEKLKLDLKRREMELEEVRRRNGLIS